jgi:hypothetical protein
MTSSRIDKTRKLSSISVHTDEAFVFQATTKPAIAFANSPMGEVALAIAAVRRALR